VTFPVSVATNPTTTSNAPGQGGVVDVVLVGGPEDIPCELRLPREHVAERALKLEWGAGYEHFECVDPAETMDRCVPLTFRWIARTKIAE
jgi:hypothetical protein